MKMTDSESAVAGVGMLVGVMALLVAQVCWAGYVTTIMWRWFVVPQFHVSALSIPYAIGIALTVQAFIHMPEEKREREWSERIAAALIRPAVLLLFGWIVMQFI